MSGGWITTTVVLTVHWIGKRRPSWRQISKLKKTSPTGRPCRRCRQILRSALRPSLRLSLPDHPGFSHKDWTKKPEGPPCHAHIFTSFHDNISIRTIPRPQPHRSSPGFAEGQQRPPFRQHQSWNTQNRHITLALVKDDGFRQLTLLSLSGALAGTFAMSSTNTWIRAPFTLLSSTLRLRHSSFLGYLGISSFVIPAVSRLVVKYAGSLG